MSGFGSALRSLTSRRKPSLDRMAELREAGLTAAEAIECVEEEEELRERQKQKEAKMPAPTTQPDFSSFERQPAVGIHDGRPYSQRDLENAKAADGLGTSAKPAPDVVFHTADTSPTFEEVEGRRSGEAEGS
jgi:hypothetical protein